MRFRSLLWLLVVFVSCGALIWLSEYNERKSAIPEVRVMGMPLDLENWALIGPFQPGGDQPLESAASLDLSESNPDQSVLADVLAKQEGNSEPKADKNFNSPKVIKIQNTPQIRFLEEFSLQQSSDESEHESESDEGDFVEYTGQVFYAVCVLRSPVARKGYLMLAHDAPAKVLLNGKVIANRDREGYFRVWNNSYPLHLSRGKNLLVVKMAPTKSRKGVVSMRYEPGARSATQSAFNNFGVVLSTRVVREGSPTKVRIRGVPTNDLIDGELYSYSTSSSKKVTGIGKRFKEIDADVLGTGLYRLSVKFDEISGEDYFCVGKPEVLFAQLIDRLDKQRYGEKAELNINALKLRFQQLSSSVESRDRTEEWQRKVVFVLKELETITSDIETGREAFINKSGLHIRGFRSKIDDQAQYYRVSVPESQPPKEGLPLIVMLPTPMASDRRFIESVFLNRHVEAELLAAEASKQGMAIVWSGFRAKPGSNPCDLGHLDEVIKEVQKNYPIDARRIYVVGSCIGGRYALDAAIEWPTRFAGIGLLNPLFVRANHSRSDNPIYQVPSFAEWWKKTEPVSRFAKQTNVPIVLVHDGLVEPGHGELRVSEGFIAWLKKHDYLPKPEFVKIEKPVEANYHIDTWRHIFAKLSRHVGTGVAGERSSTPTRLASLSDAFAERFIVVEGTGGTAEENRSIHQISLGFQKVWRETHFGPCLTVKDVDLTEAVKNTTNLILIGNEQTNLVWKTLKNSLPLHLSSDRIQLNGKEFIGRDLSIQAGFPHPGNPKKWIVVMGADRLVQPYFGTMNLSQLGWFDYAIWRSLATEASLEGTPADGISRLKSEFSAGLVSAGKYNSM